MRSQLLKRASVINEELARPGAGVDTPDPDYDNPFANKHVEENKVMASIKQHKETTMLPPRTENRKHYDEEVTKELELEKQAAPEETTVESPTQVQVQPQRDWVAEAKTLSPTEIKYMKLVLRFSGRDPMEMMPFTGAHNYKMFLQAMNQFGHKGLFEIKNGKAYKTEVTERLVMTAEALKSGAVTASGKKFRSRFLRRP